MPFQLRSKDVVSRRISLIQDSFVKLFSVPVAVIARAPGRAEIIGNHTDYNYGYALGAAISESTFVAVAPQKENNFIVFSNNFDTKPIAFSFAELHVKNKDHWTNYLKAVVLELLKKYKWRNKGLFLYVESDVPSSGGVSSSAALELAIGLALATLYGEKIALVDLAFLCKDAENGALVNSPCGFLDQGTSALAKRNNLLFLDFLPTKKLPVSEVKYVPAHLQKHNVSFFIVVDKKIVRNLGASGYPARRAICEESLPVLSQLLKKRVTSLRDISIDEFEKQRKNLNKINHVMRMRVEHIVYENNRVLTAIAALKQNDVIKFGNIITQSGQSSLDLYELDEKTPELSFLVNAARKQKGVIGARNMGGGFSANILALVKNEESEAFKEALLSLYKKRYGNDLTFIAFQPSDGAKICYIQQ